jgi:hypothetical protein
MSAFNSTTLVKQTTSKDVPVDAGIEKDRYHCYYAVDGTTADKMHVIIYLRKDVEILSVTTPGVADFNYT